MNTGRSYRGIVRILFTVYGSRPHIWPLVPLAWAFRAAGHEVRMSSTPTWSADLVATGLPTVAVGGSPRVSREVRDALANTIYSQLEPWPTDWAVRIPELDRAKWDYLEAAGRYMIAAAEAMVDDLVAFAREWAPDVVVYDSYSYAGPVAAAAIGVPGVRHLGGPDSALRLEVIQPGVQPLPEYVALFSRFGLSVPDAEPSIVDPTPPSMRTFTHPRLLSMSYVPHNGPGIAPEGLAGQRKRPRVLVTWGHSIPEGVGAAGAEPFQQAVEAIAELELDCLVATLPEEVERLGSLPGSTRTLASVPLHLVLPYCDAIVHQGGYGTALTAAAAAVPQLIIARTPETDMCAGRIVAVDAGTHLRVPDLREDPASRSTIRNTIGQLLSTSDYTAGATKLRAEIESQPTPAEVAATLVDRL